MTITSINTNRRDPALASTSGIIAGPSGINGTNGTNGRDGVNGTNGTIGRDGAPGVVQSVNGKSAASISLTADDVGAWSDTLLGGSAIPRLNLAGISGYSRTLESFGPCGNGVLSQDHAAFAAAQAWCNSRNTTLVLSAGKRYLLDFNFTIQTLSPRVYTPKFRLEAWGAEVQFSSPNAAFYYLGAWYTDKQQQEYCSFAGGVFIPTAAGTQSAISVDMKFNPSQFFKSCDIFCVEGRCDNMNDQTVYWNTFVRLNNVWNSSVFGVVANQPFGVRQGIMIAVTGLSAALRVYHCNGSWWDTGLYWGYATLVGLKGAAVSGTLTNGEIVTGSKSGTKAYVCAAGAYIQNGTTYNLVVDQRFGGTGDFDQGGETLTGATTGATYSLAANGTASIVIPGETVYASGGEFVDVNTGFNFDCPTPGTNAVRPQIGHQINNWHVNSRAYGLRIANCYQVQVSGALLYALQTNWIGVYVVGGGQVTLSPTCLIHGQGYDGTFGVLFNGSVTQCRMDPLIVSCRYGVNVPDGGQTNNDFGFSFFSCTMDVNNGAPVLSQGQAGGNSWYRTVSRQATFVGGYNR